MLVKGIYQTLTHTALEPLMPCRFRNARVPLQAKASVSDRRNCATLEAQPLPLLHFFGLHGNLNCIIATNIVALLGSPSSKRSPFKKAEPKLFTVQSVYIIFSK